jgi:hypothetical protein
MKTLINSQMACLDRDGPVVTRQDTGSLDAFIRVRTATPEGKDRTPDA